MIEIIIKEKRDERPYETISITTVHSKRLNMSTDELGCKIMRLIEKSNFDMMIDEEKEKER